MAIDLLGMLPTSIVGLDITNDLKNFLEVISETYDEMVEDTERTLRVQNVDLSPSWTLTFIARMLAAEILRLNLLENPNMEIDSDGDGLSDNWAVTGAPTTSITFRRLSKTQKLDMDDTDTFYQTLTLDNTTKYRLEARIRVTSGSVRFGDVADITKSVSITSADSDDSWTTYKLMITPNSGARNYGLVATADDTVVYIDNVRVEKNATQAMMRVWLRNAVTEYKRKGCKDGIAAVINYFTGESVPTETSPGQSWIEQKLRKFPLIYNRTGCEYLYFGNIGAPDPNLGNPADPTIYSVEWQSLNTDLDMNTVYFDFGAVENGNFDSGLSDWSVVNGSGVIGSEKVNDGIKSLKLTGTSILLRQDPVSVVANNRYVLSAWVWIPTGTTWTQAPRLIIRPAGGGAAIVTGDAADISYFGSWQQIKVVLPYTNSVASLRVELESTSAIPNYFHVDSIWMIITKWVQISVTDPGATLQAEMTDLLTAILEEYIPIGVETNIEYV
jgi:hypothetical protein